ncbi:MAG TPA: hypothetical protein V6D11_12385 [Waterburya sp.]|jgi:hypothetical protein
MAYEPISIRLGRYSNVSSDVGAGQTQQSTTTVVNNSNPAFQPFAQCQNFGHPLEPFEPLPVLDFNDQRLYAAFVNNSGVDITLVLGSILVARIGAGILLRAYGGSYEITQVNLYLGAVSAIAPDIAYLSYVECIQ